MEKKEKYGKEFKVQKRIINVEKNLNYREEFKVQPKNLIS